MMLRKVVIFVGILYTLWGYAVYCGALLNVMQHIAHMAKHIDQEWISRKSRTSS